MKFTCSKSALSAAIGTVSKALSSNAQTPLLSGIYVSAEDDVIELHATDNELGIKTSVPASVEKKGKVVVQGRYFLDVVRHLPSDMLTFSYDAETNRVRIEAGSSRFMLLSMDAADYPTVHELTSGMKIHIKDTIFSEMIKKTAFACSQDESRPAFTGCLFDVKPDTITMAATNTHRLSVKREHINGIEGERQIIIPAKVLNELTRILVSDISADIEITCADSQISFRLDSLFLTSRLIEGRFPDYQRVIPPSFATTVRLKTGDFMSAVERVSLISRGADYNIIRFEFEDGTVRISSTSQEVGNAEETIPVEMEGPAVNIAFNARYIMDVLKAIHSEETWICLNETLKPAAVKEDGTEDFTYIVTPVRTAQ
ncbi:DNA polymerase III subunit beta [Selenomonas sp. TAMA-11512]|uniref:DNA polymerase III subunit beta n=1 Tax=Selenomonas sp. TAMA-11512 TaxID=3095337 RepID=UPI0030854877|nr:DNA polymerase III subunit beta [Selenomonas sp. TAMA-11512]